MTKMNSKMVSVTALALGLLLGTPAIVTAKNTDTMTTAMENKATVQFAGSTAESVFFDVKLNNPKGEKLTLVVVNEAGDIVYLKNFDGKTNTEKIALCNNPEASRYQFTIWSAGETGEVKPVVIRANS